MSMKKIKTYLVLRRGLPRRLRGKESTANAGDRHGFDPWIGKSPGEGNGYPLQYSCLGNPMDRAWWATVHRVTKESDIT